MMNNKRVLTNLENQMTEILKCMNLISSKALDNNKSQITTLIEEYDKLNNQDIPKTSTEITEYISKIKNVKSKLVNILEAKNIQINTDISVPQTKLQKIMAEIDFQVSMGEENLANLVGEGFTDILKTLDETGSTKGNSIKEYYFSPYKDYVCILKEVLNTYAKIDSDMRNKRVYIDSIKELIDDELEVIMELSNMTVSTNVKQYKCLSFCSTALLSIMQQIGYEYKALVCKNCNKCSSFLTGEVDNNGHYCEEYHKELVTKDYKVTKLEECIK